MLLTPDYRFSAPKSAARTEQPSLTSCPQSLPLVCPYPNLQTPGSIPVPPLTSPLRLEMAPDQACLSGSLRRTPVCRTCRGSATPREMPLLNLACSPRPRQTEFCHGLPRYGPALRERP